MAPADELHKIAVTQPAYHLDLRLILLPPLLGGIFGKPLYGNREAKLSQVATVHSPEAALSKFLLRREALRSVDELVVREPPWSHPHLNLHDGLAVVVIVTAVPASILCLPPFLALTSSYKDCYHGEEENDKHYRTNCGSRYNSATSGMRRYRGQGRRWW
ncbi:Os08g0125112 [Oryza sativa Japonica Group]|uniref:Os08g0125112 protein n=1 Tax=Oryza sativa subsp. japonica TaxID=39947 RepID=A0A0P0XBN2_ORYSJ|nr:hypothetical protein EE612_041894 [Oryza sativa]BAT03645.1 Os08g0125112 [Oryza sativa Japonica Group]